MFCGGFNIKNEPIKLEDPDFPQNVVVKCEKEECVPHLIHYNNHLSVRTVICSESEYLADGNAPFESIIVKEEPRLNDCDHSANVVTTVDSSNWECYVCRYVSVNTADLRKHIQTHTKQKLESKLSTKQNLDGRKVIQIGSRHHKSLVCDYCGGKFLKKSTLTQHMHIHSGIRRFECSECDRRFTDSSTLYKHKQTHSGVRPFACNLCDRRCSRKSTLARHLKTHTGEKSFTCEICDKKFSRNSTLNHHKLIHSGENPFPCNQCDRKFKIKTSLDYHLKTHSGLMPFRCDECDRNFMTKTNLNSHLKNNKRHLQLSGDDDRKNPIADKKKANKKKSKNVTPMSQRKSLPKI